MISSFQLPSNSRRVRVPIGGAPTPELGPAKGMAFPRHGLCGSFGSELTSAPVMWIARRRVTTTGDRISAYEVVSDPQTTSIWLENG